MYQTVDRFSGNSNKGKGNKNGIEQFEYDLDDQENQSPNLYGRPPLNNFHLEAFMRHERLKQEYTFSIDGKDSCDYDDLDTYIKKVQTWRD